MPRLFKIDKSSNGMRIDRWIKNNVAKLPQSLIEKELRKGNIKLNDKKVKSSIKIKSKDEIKFYNLNYKSDNKEFTKNFIPSPKAIKKNESLIINNNDNFIVLNKLAGIPVQGGTKSHNNIIDTLSKSKIFKDTKPFTVHRLDKDTSGILIVAKNRQAASLITSLFRLRKIYKTYLAISEGEISPSSGELNHNLIRYEGRKKIIEKAKSYYKLLDYNQNLSLLELKPITGRKHQLRKQLYEIGHPICGDHKYYSKIKIKNLMLHAYEIKFKINDQKYTYKAKPPDYFTNFLKIKKIRFLEN
tara:strand:- start:698 stop:1600 length:903 start_codon:yes stop_codon:yes gene_type:complete